MEAMPRARCGKKAQSLHALSRCATFPHRHMFTNPEVLWTLSFRVFVEVSYMYTGTADLNPTVPQSQSKCVFNSSFPQSFTKFMGLVLRRLEAWHENWENSPLSICKEEWGAAEMVRWDNYLLSKTKIRAMYTLIYSICISKSYNHKNTKDWGRG